MRASFLLALVATATGCATSDPGTADAGAGDVRAEQDAAFRVDGVVAIERVRTESGAQTSVGAKFMRHTGLGRGDASAQAAERLVGSTILLPASGECRSVAELEQADRHVLSGDAEVELIDVGDVALITDLPSAIEDGFGPEARVPYLVRLAPRAFPDVGELVSGVFYTSPDLAAPLPAPGQYAIEGTGAALAAAFELEADAPGEPVDVAVDGRDLALGAHAAPGADVLVTWGAPDGGATSADRIYVDVQAEGGQVHRCTFDDNGSAVVPGALITAPSVAVAVHRLRETSSALGADEVDDEPGRVVVRFDLAVVGRVDVGLRPSRAADHDDATTKTPGG
jgi:hypothetical protein